MNIQIFAYGSNMLLRKLKVNVPSAVKLTNAYLPGFRFAFDKVSKDGSSKGNIVKTGIATDKVWGVVYEIEIEDKKALDREEGLGKGYNEEKLVVTAVDNNQVECCAYVADKSAEKENLLPYDWYRDMVVIGAIENSLESEYIAFLKAFQYSIDPDYERRKKKYFIIQPLK